MKILLSVSTLFIIGLVYNTDLIHFQKSDILSIDTTRQLISLSKAGIEKIKDIKKGDQVVWLNDQFFVAGIEDAMFPSFPVLVKYLNDSSQISCFYEIRHLPIKKQKKIKASISTLILELGPK